MSIELITGAAPTAHISANDYRAVNRANYGPGKYILKDAGEMAVSVSAASGNITIASGSVMWSGMHIRCVTPTSLTYVPPTSREVIYVWFHYVKDVQTMYESVEWVVTIGNEPSPIYDNVEDSSVEAYTLFCFFTQNADGTINDITYRFSLIDNHQDFDMDNIEKVYDQKLEIKTADLNNRINVLEGDVKNLKSPVPITTTEKSLTAGYRFTTSDYYLPDFRFLIFTFTYAGSAGHHVTHIVPTFTLGSYTHMAYSVDLFSVMGQDRKYFHSVGSYQFANELRIEFSPVDLILKNVYGIY